MDRQEVTIGVDFGTANSYFAKDKGDGKPSALGWGLNDSDSQNKVLETAVLYSESGEVLRIGGKAVEDYYESEKTEGLELRYWFKPEIGKDKNARKAAEDFLAKAISLQNARNHDLFPDHAEVIVGIPAECSADFKTALTEVFTGQLPKTAHVRLVEEPKGALVHLLCAEDKLSLAKINEGILVVDFGAGTCDFSLISGAQLVKSWGDPNLGGRLFDDLFYQIFLKNHPKASEISKLSVRDKRVLQHLLCRREKEEFSDLIREIIGDSKFSRQKQYPIGSKLRGFQSTLKGTCTISYEEFLEAAANYTPSDVLLDCFPRKTLFGTRLHEMKDNTTDLIDWFRKLLDPKSLRGREVQYVYLAGGSSRLPFISEILRETLGDSVNIEPMPAEPFMVIADGLARFLHFRKVYGDFGKDLESRLNEFLQKTPAALKKELAPKIDLAAEKFAKIIADDILDPFLKRAKESYKTREDFDQALKRELAKEDRMPEDAKQRLLLQEDDFKGEIEELLRRSMSGWLKKVADDHRQNRTVDLRFSGDKLNTASIPRTGDATLDNIDTVIGTGVLGGLAITELIAKMGFLSFFDPSGSTWVLGGILAVLLVGGTRLPRFKKWLNGQSWVYRKMVENMQDPKKRKLVIAKASKDISNSQKKFMNQELTQDKLRKCLEELAKSVIKDVKRLATL